MDNEKLVSCPYCGEEISIEVELFAGRHQTFIEDCPVCCRPIEYDIHIDSDAIITIQCRTEEGTDY